MKIYATVLIMLIVIFLTSLLSSCTSGFRAIKAPENKIVYIKNGAVNLNTEDINKSAQPLPLPILEGEPEMEVTTVPAIPTSDRDVNTPPYDSTARFTFKKGSSPYYCSAQFVGQSSVVLTAGHCIYNDRWHNSFQIHSKYHLGSSEQILDWECAAIFSGWTQDKYQWDYAFVKVRGSDPNTMSFSNANIPSSVESIGYPSNIKGGQALQGVNGGINIGTKILNMPGNPFGGGSSGGAWHSSGNVVSVNSHGYRSRPNTMYAPRFDGNVTKLYEFVELGCPETSNKEDNDYLFHLDNEKTVVQPLTTMKNWGPSLISMDTDQCDCNADGIFLVNDLEQSYEVQIDVLSAGDVEAKTDTLISNSGQKQFIGCGMPQKQTQKCASPIFASISSVARIVESESKGVFSSTTFGDPEFCAEKCYSGTSNGYCLNLGGNAATIATTLSGFINQDLREPPNENGIVATVEDMIRTFGGDPKKYEDPCERSDFTSDGTEIENSGIGCRVSVKTDKDLDIVFSLVNPPLVVGTPDTKSLTTFFERRGNAPQVEFLGNDGSDITALYGGKVVAVEKVSSHLIITTENGCLAANLRDE